MGDSPSLHHMRKGDAEGIRQGASVTPTGKGLAPQCFDKPNGTRWADNTFCNGFAIWSSGYGGGFGGSHDTCVRVCCTCLYLGAGEEKNQDFKAVAFSHLGLVLENVILHVGTKTKGLGCP